MPKEEMLGLPEKRIYIGNASFWKRIAAFILDLLVLDFIVLGAYDSLIAGMVKGSDVSSAYRLLQVENSMSTALVMLFFIITIFIVAYFVLQEYLIGQTVGKMLLSIKVVSITPGGFSPISLLQAFLRSMFLIPTIPFILLWIIDPVYYFFSKENQRLSEWLSRSKVIEVYQL